MAMGSSFVVGNRWISSGVLLLSLLLGNAAGAQGPPPIVWQSADGAGPLAFSANGAVLATASTTTIFFHNAANGARAQLDGVARLRLIVGRGR